MKVEVVYGGGNTYSEVFSSGTARIRKGKKGLSILFKTSGSGKAAGSFTLTDEDAERLAYALLLIRSGEEKNSIEFSVGEKQ